MYAFTRVAGLDLPVKLRRGLGKGKVVPAEELTRRLLKFDGDGDGNLNREDLTKFFMHHRVGGPWFCKVVTKTLWDIAEERWSEQIESITANALGRVISYSMARPARRASRYVITPEAVQGLVEKRSVGANAAGAPSRRPVAEAGGPRPGGRPAVRAPVRGRAPGRAPGRAGPRRAGPRPRR
ncbi:MAG: hypothetical protein AAFN74_17680 [Myxococcota bacterium]